MAGALKQLGRKEESLRQVQLLLKEEAGSKNAEALGYWKQRAGNDIANQFYKEGEFLKALDIYVTLASLNDKPTWQCPVLYQVGLIYERLAQPARAVEYYQKVLNREKDVGPDALSSLQAVFDLARWRSRFLTWEVQAEAAQKDLIDPPEDLPLPEPNAKPSS
jgi:tetratricopeptide (TPR) repeat protein